MSKEKQIHKSGDQIKAEKLVEAAMRKEAEQNEKYVSTTYRPNEALPLTGEAFLTLRHRILQARNARVIQILGETPAGRGVIGQGLHPNDNDIEALLSTVNAMHKAFVDAGLGVNVEVLIQEMEAEQNSEQESVSTLITE